MKCRLAFAILCGVFFSSFAIAQTPSHFDLSGNLSYDGQSLPYAPSSSTHALGWETSGSTRINRWLAFTSEISSSTTSANGIQLIGYTGDGTLRHYSALVGPRFIFPTRSRFSPFIEGLAGADRASTSFVSNGTTVTGREVQWAYGFGGGAQVIMSRHFALNFEGEYLGSEHTVAYTGWEPAHFQFAAGIVIRMYGRGPQIAEQSHPPTPAPRREPSATPTVAESTPTEVSATTVVANSQPVISAPIVKSPVQPEATAISNVQIPITQYTSTAGPAAAPITIQPIMAAKVVTTREVKPTTAVEVRTPVVLTPAPQSSLSTPYAVKPAVQTVAVATPVSASPVEVKPLLPAPRPSAASTPVVPAPAAASPAAPVVTAQAAPPVVPARTAAQAATAQTFVQSEAPPISLGEYARRLREKKQQEQNQSH